MESFGIIEMLGWYVVGFSATIDSSNNFEAKHLEEKRKEAGISRIFTHYPQIRIKCS